MSKYKELYQYCQTLSPKVSRRDIERKALEIAEKKKITAVKSGLDPAVCRGLFISVSNQEHPLVRQIGTDIIILARGLNYCWERIVYTKELMHLFDSEGEPTDTGDKFESLLTEFEMQSPDQQRSDQFNAEIECLWMALGCLCPEPSRLQFVEQMERGHIDEYGVALQLKIPEKYIKHLKRTDFPDIMAHLCGK